MILAQESSLVECVLVRQVASLGDLVLTCTSEQSRNFRFGQTLGRGETFDPSVTVEGAATARVVARLAGERGLDMPSL